MEKINNLILQKEFGVDETISITPINRFLPKKNIGKNTGFGNNVIELRNNAPKNNIELRVSSAPAVHKSREIAKKCSTLEELKDAIVNLEDISIKKTAINTVFADGDSDSEIMFIGEAPGAEEDKQGIPFCGASGKFLDEALSYIELHRENNFYITNTIFWRPPGNRKPTNEELDICKPFVEKHISLINPKLIILVGGTAVFSLLGENKKITKTRGQYFKYSNEFLKNDIDITAIFHPSYLLRQPSQKKIFWYDLLKIRMKIKTMVD